jgi:hypothetical protein
MSAILGWPDPSNNNNLRGHEYQTIRFIDIGGIDDRHYLTSFFII